MTSMDRGTPDTALMGADPRTQYALGGPWGAVSARGGYLYAQVEDEVVRQYGPRVYELMSYDPAVACGQALLRAGVIADGVQLSVPGELQEAPIGLDEGGIAEFDDTPLRRQELELAGEVLEFCVRGQERLAQDDLPVEETLWEMLDATMAGCILAEQVMDLETTGPDRGRYVPSVLAVKPNWAWAFRVDPMLRVEGFRVWTGDGWRDIEREHFALFSFQPRARDPRGTSMGRSIYTPWNIKLQAMPDYAEYLRKFASAALAMTASKDARDQEVIDPQTGRAQVYTVQQQMIDAGRHYKQHSILGLPFGVTATVIQASGNGEAFGAAFDRFDRDIFRAMILSTRPVMEAKHGSKADSESGMDLMGLAVQRLRGPLARMYRKDVLRRWVELNWGPQIARRFTPSPSFGLPNHVKPELMGAFADAWDKGLFDYGQRPEIWNRIGFPMPIGGMDPRPSAAPEPAPVPNPVPEPDGTMDGEELPPENQGSTNPAREAA